MNIGFWVSSRPWHLCLISTDFCCRNAAQLVTLFKPVCQLIWIWFQQYICREDGKCVFSFIVDKEYESILYVSCFLRWLDLCRCEFPNLFRNFLRCFHKKIPNFVWNTLVSAIFCWIHSVVLRNHAWGPAELTYGPMAPATLVQGQYSHQVHQNKHMDRFCISSVPLMASASPLCHLLNSTTTLSFETDKTLFLCRCRNFIICEIIYMTVCMYNICILLLCYIYISFNKYDICVCMDISSI